MTERPIIFSAPMVRALLEGRKTQTRRILKHQPICPSLRNGVWTEVYDPVAQPVSSHPLNIRFAPGDRLWVRENWRTVGDAPLSETTGPSDFMFAASTSEAERAIFKWRPSIHMPRWASRLTLVVTGVKVERLRDISEEDAAAEGVYETEFYNNAEHKVSSGAPWSVERLAFADLWSSINGPDAWDANPWVVAVSFTVHLANIDAMQEAA